MSLLNCFMASTCELTGSPSVLVNSNDGPNNTWIGRVRSIRRRKPPGGEEVWLLVQWYYSANDIGAVKGLKLSEAYVP